MLHIRSDLGISSFAADILDFPIPVRSGSLLDSTNGNSDPHKHGVAFEIVLL